MSDTTPLPAEFVQRMVRMCPSTSADEARYIAVEALKEVPKGKVRVDLDVTDSLCSDILCTAIEGGTGYWAVLDDINRAPVVKGVGETGDGTIRFDEATTEEVEWPWVYVCALFCDTEHDEEDEESEPQFEPQVVTYDVIRKGIAAILSPGADIGSRLRGYIFAGVIGNDGGEIDADAADAIVQFGMFGKLVFG
jgi:hypothetical protein